MIHERITNVIEENQTRRPSRITVKVKEDFGQNVFDKSRFTRHMLQFRKL